MANDADPIDSTPAPPKERPRRRKKRRRAAAPVDDELSFGRARATPAGGAVWAMLSVVAIVGGVIFLHEVHPLITGGATIVLGVIALVRQSTKDCFARLSWNAQARTLTLFAADGRSVALPVHTVTHVSATRHTSTSQRDEGGTTQKITWMVGVHKRDGGYLQVLAHSEDEEDEAKRAASALSDAIKAASTEDWRKSSETEGDALEALRASRAVQVDAAPAAGAGSRRPHAADEPLRLSWGATIPILRVLPFVTVCAGMALCFLGFGPENAGTAIMAYFMGALGALVILFFLLSIAVRVHVAVGDDGLTVERRRFGRRIAHRRFPLDGIEAIDFTNAMQGGALTIRAASPDGAAAGGGGGAIGTVWGWMQRNQQVPTGDLAITECVLIDLALSEELARRKRVAAGTV